MTIVFIFNIAIKASVNLDNMPTKDSIFSLSMTKVIDRFGKSDKDVYQTIPIIASLTQLVQSVTLTRWKSLVRTQQGAQKCLYSSIGRARDL